MTASHIAWTAILLGIGGLVSPRVMAALLFTQGVLYLALGWVPFGP